MTKKKNVARVDVAEWANDALKSAGGEAWWQNPITPEVWVFPSHMLWTCLTLLMPQNEKARGMFMSVYMLRAFAPHLAIVERSCLEAREPQFGALAMAAAAASPTISGVLHVLT